MVDVEHDVGDVQKTIDVRREYSIVWGTSMVWRTSSTTTTSVAETTGTGMRHDLDTSEEGSRNKVWPTRHRTDSAARCEVSTGKAKREEPSTFAYY